MKMCSIYETKKKGRLFYVSIIMHFPVHHWLPELEPFCFPPGFYCRDATRVISRVIIETVVSLVTLLLVIIYGVG